MSRYCCLVFMCLLIPGILIAQDEQKSSLTQIGQMEPNFKVTTLDGKEIELVQQKGKVILLNFFATWCAPCMAEMPHLEKDIWQKNKTHKDLLVIAIGREHSREELKKFNDKKGLTFALAPDPQRAIYSLFAEQFIPRNYLIDREGKIVYQSIGYNEKDFKLLQDQIDQLLNQKVN
jgi:peroxiredoxin